LVYKIFIIHSILFFLFFISCSNSPTSSKEITPETGTVTDIDGNVYKTVKIGNQWWMAENLKVTRYRNGDAIYYETDNTAWSNLTKGAYCASNNDIGNIATYGLLYNWYAVSDSRNIAPVGWHIPTHEEWKEMEMYLGMSQSETDKTGHRGKDEGNKLKAQIGWTNNGNGTNESGFTALPGGSRFDYDGTFSGIGSIGFWWTATLSASTAWFRALDNNHSTIFCSYYDRKYGFSVRCVKD